MPLQKQPININFSKGLDTKTDPNQVSIGNFSVLQNSVFTKGGLLQKRNGFAQLPTLINSDANFLTTYNGNLTSIGTQLDVYSDGSNQWINKGMLHPVQLNTLSLNKDNNNQTQADSAVSDNNLICTVYHDIGTVDLFKYQVTDYTTGQVIVNSNFISGAGYPGRVFFLGKYFIIVYKPAAANTLSYISINTVTLEIGTPVTISTQFSYSAGIGNFDGVVANNTLYLFWKGTDGGGAIRYRTLSSTLTFGTVKSIASFNTDVISVSADITGSTPTIFLVFYDYTLNNSYQAVFDASLNTITSPVQILPNNNVINIATAAQNGTVSVIYEFPDAYTYNTSIPTNFLTFDSRQTDGSQTSGFVRYDQLSVGLASKTFIDNGVVYFIATYQSPNQPTYFLLDFSKNIISRFAYQIGNGYYSRFLPQFNYYNNEYSAAYIVKDLIQAANKDTGATVINGVYTQTGVNLIKFKLTTDVISTSEIGSNLQITGGFLGSYDGLRPVENNFFLYPDSVQTEYITGGTVTPTGTFSSGGTTITLSSATGVVVGYLITDTTTPASISSNTYVTAINGTVITISRPTTAAGAGDSLVIGPAVAARPDGTTNTNAYYYQVVYQWSDNQGNFFTSAPSIPVSLTTTGSSLFGSVSVYIPTLRLTYKIDNPVKITVYRWSVANQIYYQVSSVIVPTLNNTTVNYITFRDTLSDNQAIGNNIIYTNGGVVENVAPPSTSITTLYKSRLFLVDAENPNVLWYSKQVVQATPVEMSDLFTIYIAPTTGAQGSTGPITALSALDDKLIIFKENAIYYITGNGPDNTGANNDFSEPVFITSTVGCANSRSIVFMPQGLMFQSDKGIWLLGRDLSTQYIGAPVEAFNQFEVNSALNIPGTNQVRFTLSNGVTLMYDYYYGQWGTFVGIPAISSTLYQGVQTFINKFAQAFQESNGIYLDGSNPVLMSFTTGWLNFSGLQGFERAYFFYFLGTYFSPHKINVSIAYDYNTSPTQVTLITPNNYSPVYGGETLYGSGGSYGGPGALEQWRIFLERQKCQSFQITMTEVFDATLGVAAGAGLSISGLDFVVGIKGGYPRIASSNYAG